MIKKFYRRVTECPHVLQETLSCEQLEVLKKTLKNFEKFEGPDNTCYTLLIKPEVVLYLLEYDTSIVFSCSHRYCTSGYVMYEHLDYNRFIDYYATKNKNP